MTHIEFKQFLTQYKSLSDIVKKIFEQKNSNENFGGFTIVDGKIMLIINNYETYMEDITKEVYAELIPDDLIF